MIADLLFKETLNGGDLVLKGRDLYVTKSFYNMVYLAWFGGNTEQSTRSDETSNNERFDYWANNTLFKDNVAIQYNSALERTLMTTQLNSRGIATIEEVATSDLEFMKEFANFKVEVELISVDRLSIVVYSTDLDNGEKYKFLWNATTQEIEDKNIDEESDFVPIKGKFNVKFNLKFN